MPAVRPVISHQSAAAHWRLDLHPGQHPEHDTVPRNASRTPAGAAVRHRADLRPGEVVVRDGVAVTSVLRTIRDCAQVLPFGQALAVADSALRLRRTTEAALRQAALRSSGPGSAAFRRVARFASRRAGSYLESLLRALMIDGRVGPIALQTALTRDGHAYDLAVPDALLLIEADGSRFHRSDERVLLDCEDVTLAAVAGWAVLRFGWYHVVHRPEWTLAMIRTVVADRRADLRRRQRADAELRRRTRRAHRQATNG